MTIDRKTRHMKWYDVVVIGAGDAGLGIVFKALSEGLKVALVDKGTVGGTCINTGCVPSKTLIAAADRFMESRGNSKLGIRSQKSEVDFSAVMKRMKSVVADGRNAVQKALKGSKGLDFIHREGHFVDEHTLEAGGHKIRGKRIFIATGAQPQVPPIPGLDTVDYLTNRSILRLEHKPESMLFIGGGFIALEYAHFFSALGVRVSIVERNAALLRFGEPEISELLKNKLGERISLHMGAETIAVRHTVKGHAVTVKNVDTGRKKEIFAETVVVSAGRTSNTDLLRPELAGVLTDAGGFIRLTAISGRTKNTFGRSVTPSAGQCLPMPQTKRLNWHGTTQHTEKRSEWILRMSPMRSIPGRK
jgi:dihydrolipoamide dehydrogenase